MRWAWQDTVQQARKAGVEVIGRRCDVGEPSQVSSVVAEILSRWGGVDILVNNAGITYYGPTVQMSAEHWDRVLRVNLLSHIQFTRELLPSLLARREAHVVNVCSMFGLVGMPKLAAYSTTKFALVGFSESLRNECGRDGLGVTALCPGFRRHEPVHVGSTWRKAERTQGSAADFPHDAGKSRPRGREGHPPQPPHGGDDAGGVVPGLGQAIRARRDGFRVPLGPAQARRAKDGAVKRAA